MKSISRKSSPVMYHFTGKTLRDGRPIPPIGEWLTHDGPIEMCASGLHASPTPWAALQYAPGELLHRVELRGDLIHEKGDKSVGRKRRIVATINSTDILRRFARAQALKVIHLWEAPSIVREYLETGDESKRADARAAAGAAAWAAGAAARDAARAARDAAWAARDAAWAARDAAWNAGDAAWAARDAAWNAGAAAGAAAWAAGAAARAARDAAWDAAGIEFNAMVEEEFERLGK